jgi:hypothetical protein
LGGPEKDNGGHLQVVKFLVIYREKETSPMKKLIAMIFVVLLTGTFALAGGDQNQHQKQGSNGQGETSTGSSAQGDASQSRAGR